jgi:hypothetical protein
MVLHNNVLLWAHLFSEKKVWLQSKLCHSENMVLQFLKISHTLKLLIKNGYLSYYSSHNIILNSSSSDVGLKEFVFTLSKINGFL